MYLWYMRTSEQLDQLKDQRRATAAPNMHAIDSKRTNRTKNLLVLEVCLIVVETTTVGSRVRRLAVLHWASIRVGRVGSVWQLGYSAGLVGKWYVAGG